MCSSRPQLVPQKRLPGLLGFSAIRRHGCDVTTSWLHCFIVLFVRPSPKVVGLCELGGHTISLKNAKSPDAGPARLGPCPGPAGPN